MLINSLHPIMKQSRQTDTAIKPSFLPQKPHFRLKLLKKDSYCVGIALHGHMRLYKGIEAKQPAAAMTIAWALYCSGLSSTELGLA